VPQVGWRRGFCFRGCRLQTLYAVLFAWTDLRSCRRQRFESGVLLSLTSVVLQPVAPGMTGLSAVPGTHDPRVPSRDRQLPGGGSTFSGGRCSRASRREPRTTLFPVPSPRELVLEEVPTTAQRQCAVGLTEKGATGRASRDSRSQAMRSERVDESGRS
jgi:hypothetical protein